MNYFPAKKTYANNTSGNVVHFDNSREVSCIYNFHLEYVTWLDLYTMTLSVVRPDFSTNKV